MGKIVETKLNNFSGGISDDIREVALNKFSITKHFDTTTNPKKLIPYRSIEDESPTAGNAIGNLLYSSLGELVALGKESNGYPALWFKASASTQVTDAWAVNRTNWNETGTKDTLQYPLFKEYNAYIYYCTSASTTYYLNRARLLFSDGAIAQRWQTLSGIPTGQGLVHSKSATLFIPCGNVIASVTSAGAFDADCAPSIASNYEITSLAEHSDYVAIACRDKSGGNSKVILWDGVSTTTFIESNIDWGRDDLYVLNNLDGYLIGVASVPTGLFSSDQARISIKGWGGGKPFLIKEVYAEKLGVSNPSTTLYPRVNFIYDNRLYFSAEVSGGSTPSQIHIGLFSIGRKNANYPFSVNFERFATNDNSETSIISALLLRGYCWTNHTAVGTITRTDDQANYVATSIYESQKLNGEYHGFDSSYTKKLLGVSVQHDKLPASAYVTIKYRCDGATTWTSITKNTTDDSLSKEVINADTDLDGTPDANLPQYKEIEFRLESYGGAAITGFSFREELIDKRVF